MKLDVLVFAAHPDDAELSMGGTIAVLTNSGKKVGIIDMTEGELGTRGSVDTRYNEAAKAAEILKLSVRENLKLPDGGIKPTVEYRTKIIEKIRNYKPQIIFAPYPNDRHPDHIGASRLVKEAMFFCGLPKIATSVDDINQDVFRPKKLYYFMQTYEFQPSFIVDISPQMETKMKSVYAYSSQFYNPDSNEPETFISKPGFVKYLEARAVFYGFKIGKNFGEPFFTEEQVELDIVNEINSLSES